MSGERKIQRWANDRRMRFQRTPDPSWYVQWEPFDTMVAPARYVNSAVAALPHGYLAIVEPWTAEGSKPPLDRTLLGFATHAGLLYRASARFGEWFNTRVAFVGSDKPNEVTVGDSAWDAVAKTFAMTQHHAMMAFHEGLRKMVLAWRFRGHLELRTGGLVVHMAGLRPLADDYDRLFEFMNAVVPNSVCYPGQC